LLQCTNRMLEATLASVNDSLRYRNSWGRIVAKLQHYPRGKASLGLSETTQITSCRCQAKHGG
jgi:hypothetical protein